MCNKHVVVTLLETGGRNTSNYYNGNRFQKSLIAPGAWFYSFVSDNCQPPLDVYLSLIEISVCTVPFRQIKGNCAESFTEYWTCLDYTNLAELRHCRKQQQSFDSCVLDKLGWEGPELGDLSKVRLNAHLECEQLG